MNQEETPVIVAIGSKNNAKNLAVTKAFERAFRKPIHTESFDAASGIAEQPTTDEESITGAKNRAHAALGMLASAQYGVGLEGNTVTIAGRMYLHGWVAVIERSSGLVGIGHSSGIELPNDIQRGIEAGEELGPLMQNLLRDTENTVRHSLGTNGVLSGGLYTREQEFIDATTVALARFVSPQIYR